MLCYVILEEKQDKFSLKYPNTSAGGHMLGGGVKNKSPFL